MLQLYGRTVYPHVSDGALRDSLTILQRQRRARLHRPPHSSRRRVPFIPSRLVSALAMEQKRLLLITNSELGQGNVYLAVSHELLRLDPSLDLHFCSFAPLSKAVASLKEAVSPEGRTPQVTFHELHGPTWKEALFTRPEHRWEEICSLHPSAWNTRKAAPLMPRVCTPWTPDELVDLVQQVEKIILEVNADLVLVDNLFTPGITVCYELKPNWSILSPNTYREFILGNQPNREYLWKHPPFVPCCFYNAESCADSNSSVPPRSSLTRSRSTSSPPPTTNSDNT